MSNCENCENTNIQYQLGKGLFCSIPCTIEFRDKVLTDIGRSISKCNEEIRYDKDTVRKPIESKLHKCRCDIHKYYKINELEETLKNVQSYKSKYYPTKVKQTFDPFNEKL